MSATETVLGDTSVVFRRVYAAPPATVFAALADPEALTAWWGSATCPVRNCSVDFRVGGEWRYAVGAHGPEHWVMSTYTAIDAPRRLAFVERSASPEGEVTDALPPTDTEITLEDVPGGTIMTVTLTYPHPQHLADARERGVFVGLPQALDALSQTLATPRGARERAI